MRRGPAIAKLLPKCLPNSCLPETAASLNKAGKSRVPLHPPSCESSLRWRMAGWAVGRRGECRDGTGGGRAKEEDPLNSGTVLTALSRARVLKRQLAGAGGERLKEGRGETSVCTLSMFYDMAGW